MDCQLTRHVREVLFHKVFPLFWQEKTMSVTGRSWGDAVIDGSTLVFHVDGRPAFRFPLADVGGVSPLATLAFHAFAVSAWCLPVRLCLLMSACMAPVVVEMFILGFVTSATS